MDRFTLGTMLLVGVIVLYLLSQPSQPPQTALAASNSQPGATARSAPPGTGFDLHFTAVDGAPVDVSRMVGKVVLIDFWATWCPPCREEVPNVVAAYDKYHAKGFEVVGISLDQNRDELTSFTQQNGMEWPQYFDGQGWDNAISKRFGIDSIPAMWLIGKDGKLITTNARDNLDGYVEQALSVP